MIDKLLIRVKAGNGGNGTATFRREKFVPFGGPDGGDGGDGGNVILVADSRYYDLRHLRYNKLYQAKRGVDGRSKKRYGRRGDNLIINVPLGTVVTDGGEINPGEIIGDLHSESEEIVVVHGGKGGRGNVHFATSTNQAPQEAEKGEFGEERTLILEIRLIADVGIIGYPNAGKSSLLANATGAKPKIADYAFTTKEATPGVVLLGKDSFVLAEIPGLITGAHTGRGLGHQFLRHALRTRLLIHLIDGMAESPLEAMIQINNELSLYDAYLAAKPQIAVVNKIDLPQVRERMRQIKKEFQEAATDVHFISATTGEGVAELLGETMTVLNREPAEGVNTAPVTVKIFRPVPKQ